MAIVITVTARTALAIAGTPTASTVIQRRSIVPTVIHKIGCKLTATVRALIIVRSMLCRITVTVTARAIATARAIVLVNF